MCIDRLAFKCFFAFSKICSERCKQKPCGFQRECLTCQGLLGFSCVRRVRRLFENTGFAGKASKHCTRARFPFTHSVVIRVRQFINSISTSQATFTLMAEQLQLDRCFDCLKKHHQLPRCSICKTAHYCDRECQRRDLPIHKLFCKIETRLPAAEENKNNLSTDNNNEYVQALLFEHDAREPVFVRLEKTQLLGGDVLLVSNHIPGQEMEIRSEEFPPVIFNSKGDCEQSNGFSLVHDANSELPVNKSMRNALKGRAKANFSSSQVTKIMGNEYWRDAAEKVKKWRGNVLVIKSDRYKMLDLERPTYEDLDKKDIPDVIMFLWLLSLRLFKQAEG